MAVSPISPRMRRMQWIAIGLVTAAIALNYLDRSTLAIGNVKIRQEFGISATAIGALQSAWSITYALCQVPIGYFLDRLGPRWLVGVALLLWSLAQAAGGFAVSYVQLLWARVALGAAECPAFPAAVRVTSDWFHVKDRGAPTGLYNSGGSIGPFIAPPLLTGLMLAFGWRTMFITMGLIGVLGAVVWFMLYRDPAKTELAPQDAAYLATNRAAEGKVELRNWGKLFRFQSMWGLMLGAFCTGYAVWMYQTWLPAYLEMQQHISIAKTGFLASIPLFCSIIGAWSGGWFTDRLNRRGHGTGGEPPAARHPRPGAVGCVHGDRDNGQQSNAGHRLHFAGDVLPGGWDLRQVDADHRGGAAIVLHIGREHPEFRRLHRWNGVADRHRVRGGCYRVIRDRAGDRGGDHHPGRGAVADAGAFADHLGRSGRRHRYGGAGAVRGEAA